MTDQTPQGGGPPPDGPPNAGWGAPQPPSPKRRRGPSPLGWIGIALGAFLLLGVIGSITGGNQTDTAVRQTSAAATTGVTATEPPPTTELAISTTATPTTRPPTTRRATTTTAKPTPTTRKAAPTTPAPASNCDPAYPDACLHDGIGDYDCAGGSGNGPNYVEGPIQVRSPDPFDLDRDGDGVGCES